MRTGVVLATGAAALVGLIIGEGQLPASWLPLEEAAIAEQGRGEKAAPGTTVAGLYPLLVGTVAARVDGDTLLAVARLFNALLWAALAVPAFFLAYARAPPLVAAAAAAGTVLVPAAVYASALTPDATATLLVACAIALFAHPRIPERGWGIAASFTCAVGAAALRPWFAAVPLGLALAYALPRVPWRALAPSPRPVALALMGGVAVTALAGISPELERATLEPWTLLRASVAGAAAGAIGMAVVPWIVAWAQAPRALDDPLVAVLVTVGPALAIAAGFAAVADEGPRVDERAVVALTPAVMALAAGAFAGARISERAFLVTATATAGAMGVLPAPVEDPALVGAPGLALLWSLVTGVVGAGALFGLLTVGLAFAVVGAWRRPYVWALLAAALLLAHMTARREAERSARAIATTLPDPSWLDSHVDATAAVTLVDARRDLAPPLLAELALVNRSLGPLLPVDASSVDSSTGVLAASAPTKLALGHGIELAGSRVAQGPLGTLVRSAGPLRVADLVVGVDAEGWMGSRAVYRRFTASGRPGTIRLTVSRRAWTRPDVPGRVTIHVAAGGRVHAERQLTIHSGQHHVIEFEVPSGPLEVEIRVEPTFSPAAFGAPDTRQLGAQVVFEFPGG